MLLSGVSYPAGHDLTAGELAGIITAVQGLSGSVAKAADESVTSSTTLQDDDELFFTVAANAVYEVGGFLRYLGVAGVGIFKVGWSGPASATFDWLPSGLIDTDTANTADHMWGGYKAIGDSNTFGGSGSTAVVARPYGRLVTSTAGTFKLRWAQGTSSGTATTLKAQSYLIYRRIT